MNATLLHRCYNRTGEAATWMPGLECLLWVDIDNEFYINILLTKVR